MTESNLEAQKRSRLDAVGRVPACHRRRTQGAVNGGTVTRLRMSAAGEGRLNRPSQPDPARSGLRGRGYPRFSVRGALQHLFGRLWRRQFPPIMGTLAAVQAVFEGEVAPLPPVVGRLAAVEESGSGEFLR